MSKLLVSRNDLNNYKTEVINTYATKSEIQAANYGTKGDLAAYALKSDLTGYQQIGDYALKSDLGEYQQKVERGFVGMSQGLQPKGDYALKSDLTGYQPKDSNQGLTKEDVSLIKSTMGLRGDDLVVKGNIVMSHPNGDEWIIGMRDSNHFAINKLDKTGKNRGSGAGFLIRNDGVTFNGPRDEDWYRSWQHNIHKGRR